MYNVDKLKNSLERLELTVSEKQIQQFMGYYNILIEWNKVMNLTTIIDFSDVIDKHFIDSLEIIKVLDLKNCSKCIDVGTGAGFPGIPIKIMYPELDIILLDSLNKRIKFLNEVIQALDLSSISAVHGRAEEYGKKDDFREMFDIVVSRAVANLASLSEYCIPFAKKDGYFISYKSGNVLNEIELSKNAIMTLGGKLEKLEKFKLPNTDIERTFVVIKKTKETPKKYPRGSGKPLKEPIA